MYQGRKFLAVIPARGGSKGIPNKNILIINGKPLIEYTISAALNSKYLDRVIVSTDSEQIAEISKQCGAEIPFLRPESLAKDESKIIETIVDLFDKMPELRKEYHYLVLLQPTQPLRHSKHIDEAIELIVRKGANSLASVCEVDDHPVLIRTIDQNQQLVNLINVNSTIRRQDFKKYYKVNGAIYINRIDENLNMDTSFNDNKLAYIMDKKYDVDIDYIFDVEIFKLKLNWLRKT